MPKEKFTSLATRLCRTAGKKGNPKHLVQISKEDVTGFSTLFEALTKLL